MKPSGKYSLLLSLYLAQSVPMSFFSTALPVILRQENFSLTSIGLLQFVKLPWLLKLFWAPAVDATARDARGYRKWIVTSEIFYAVVVFSMALFDLRTDFSTIVPLIVIALLFSATQDIATDALAVRLLKPEERGPGNAVQSAGGFLGTVVGSGLLLAAYGWFGWKAVALGLGALVLLAVSPVFTVKTEDFAAPHTGRKVRWLDIVGFFKGNSAPARIFLLLTLWAGIIGIIAMLKPFFVDKGLSLTEIAFLNGVVGTAFAAASSLLGGQLIKRAGLRFSLNLFLVLNALAALFLYAVNHSGSHLALYAGSIGIWTAYGFSSVAVYVFAMNGVRGGLEGTDFTSQIFLTQLSALLISALSGRVADKLGYDALFFGGAVISAAVLAVLNTKWARGRLFPEGAEDSAPG
ncbi:MFS transporter [bacterium]|nr:MAG: MFS transporter [bacterium]